MRWFWKLITAELEVTLALLMLLGSIVALSWVQAGTADMNVTLTVLGEGGGDSGGGSSGGSGSTSSSTPSTPASPTPVASVVPPPEKKPPAEFKLVDCVPKIIPFHRDALIVLYGYNFPSDFKIVVKAKDAMLIADSTAANKKAVVIEGAALEAVQYVVPAKTLSPGEAVLLIERAGQVLTPPLSILVYDPTKAINLRAQIAQRTINVTVASGQSANVTIKFKNIGLTEWDYLLQPLHIGTSSPYDRKSRFVHKNWPYNNRAVRIDLPLDVNTGETFDVTLPIQAPVVKRTTRYTENFALVAEGIAWISGSNFTVRITVNPPAVAQVSKKAVAKAKQTPPLATAAIVKPAAPYRIPNTFMIIAAQQDHSWWTSVRSFLMRLFGSPTLALRQ
jgi:hypothetical protein